MIVIVYDRLTAIVRSCELKREICQTFQIVPRQVVRTNERTNAWNSRARRVAVSPFSKGEKRSSRTERRTLDVYLTRSNLIKNLIKSDFWAAPESVPNQPRRGNKTRKEFSVSVPCALAPCPSAPHVYGTLRYKRVSRFESHGRFFSDTCLCLCAESRFEIVMRTTTKSYNTHTHTHTDT